MARDGASPLHNMITAFYAKALVDPRVRGAAAPHVAAHMHQSLVKSCACVEVGVRAAGGAAGSAGIAGSTGREAES